MAEALYADSKDSWEQRIAKRMGRVGRNMELKKVLNEENPNDLIVENHFLKSKFRNKYRIRKRRK
jgi:hypothetical protein